MSSGIPGMVPTPVHLDDTYVDLVEREQRWHTRPGEVWGVDTGFQTINRKTGGLHPGFIALGARTSHGKTALSMQIALNVAQQIYDEWTEGDVPPAKVLIFSPEMNPDELMERYASQMSGVPVMKIKRGRASDEERSAWLAEAEALTLLAPCIDLYAGADQSFGDIISIIDQTMTAHREGGPGIKLVVVDYLQRLRYGAVGETEYGALTRMANALKTAANTYRIPILVASQLNRAIERDHQTGKMQERPPELSDFHGSGAIEQACDMALLLWRPPEPVGETEAEQDGDDPNPVQRAFLYVKKNRHGPVGEARLLFRPAVVRFEDPTGYYRGARRAGSED